MELHVCRKGRTDPLLFFIFWMWRVIFHGGWKTNKFYFRNPSVLLVLSLVLAASQTAEKMIKQENIKYFAWNARQINRWQGHFHCSLKYELMLALSMKNLPYIHPFSRQLQLPVPEIPSFPWHVEEPTIWWKLPFLPLPCHSSKSALSATIQLRNSFPAIIAWQLWTDKELFLSLLPLYSG